MDLFKSICQMQFFSFKPIAIVSLNTTDHSPPKSDMRLIFCSFGAQDQALLSQFEDIFAWIYHRTLPMQDGAVLELHLEPADTVQRRVLHE